jgi:hypothetical protein
MIRTTNDVMRSLLFQASLSARYWAESLHAATYLLNLLPTKAISTLSPTSLFSAPLPPTPTYGSSGVLATRTPLSLLPISSPLAPISVSFLGIPLSTRGTGVSFSARTACWSPGRSSSTSHPSPLPPSSHLLTTWTPSSHPVLQFARLLHPTPLVLQVLQSLTPCHMRLRHPSSCHRCPRLRHTRPRRLRPHHARHRHPSPCHTRPGRPSRTTRGLDVFVRAMCGLGFTLH